MLTHVRAHPEGTRRRAPGALELLHVRDVAAVLDPLQPAAGDALGELLAVGRRDHAVLAAEHDQRRRGTRCTARQPLVGDRPEELAAQPCAQTMTAMIAGISSGSSGSGRTPVRPRLSGRSKKTYSGAPGASRDDRSMTRGGASSSHSPAGESSTSFENRCGNARQDPRSSCRPATRPSRPHPRSPGPHQLLVHQQQIGERLDLVDRLGVTGAVPGRSGRSRVAQRQPVEERHPARSPRRMRKRSGGPVPATLTWISQLVVPRPEHLFAMVTPPGSTSFRSSRSLTVALPYTPASASPSALRIPVGHQRCSHPSSSQILAGVASHRRRTSRCCVARARAASTHVEHREQVADAALVDDLLICWRTVSTLPQITARVSTSSPKVMVGSFGAARSPGSRTIPRSPRVDVARQREDGAGSPRGRCGSASARDRRRAAPPPCRCPLPSPSAGTPAIRIVVTALLVRDLPVTIEDPPAVNVGPNQLTYVKASSRSSTSARVLGVPPPRHPERRMWLLDRPGPDVDPPIARVLPVPREGLACRPRLLEQRPPLLSSERLDLRDPPFWSAS